MRCSMTDEECKTPSMCAPYGGCVAPDSLRVAELEKRVQRLESLMSMVAKDKSNDT